MIKKLYIVILLLVLITLGLLSIQLNTVNKAFSAMEDDFNMVNQELEEANKIISDLKSEEYKFVYMGEYKLTHYCSELYKHICGTGSGKTATGTKVTPGRTVAVDPTVIPYGAQMYIEGYGFRIAEDCGGAVKNKQIDIAVETHDEANTLGTKSGGVWLLIKK